MSYIYIIQRKLEILWTIGILFVFFMPLLVMYIGVKSIDKYYITAKTSYINNNKTPKQGGVIDDAPEAWNNKKYIMEK